MPNRGSGRTKGTTRSLPDQLVTLNGRLFGEVTPDPKNPYAVAPLHDGLIGRARSRSKLGS